MKEYVAAKYSLKYLPYFKLIFGAVLLIIVVRTCKKATNATKQDCEIESKLEFDGVLKDYNTGSSGGRLNDYFILAINDSFYKIPHSQKGITLYTGDTVKKIRGEHLYYVRRCPVSAAATNRQRDTIVFNCP